MNLKSLNSKSHSKTVLNDQCIKRVPLVPGEKGVRKCLFCTICTPHSTVLKLACYRGRVPPIVWSKERRQTIKEHLKSKVQQECLKTECSNKLSALAKLPEVPLVKMLTFQRQKLANKIDSHIIHVYNDAKCLTTSAFSRPPKVIATKIAHQFNYSEPSTPYNPSDFILQYIRPPVLYKNLYAL